MKAFFSSFIFSFVIVLAGILLIACEQQEDPVPAGPDPTQDEIVVNPKTIVLDPSRFDQVVEYNEEGQYMIVKDLNLGTPLSETTRAESYVKAQDDYYFICTATDQIPEGAFKKIKTVEPFGNQYKVTFDPLANFGLQDVILNGACHKSVPHSNIESVTDEDGNSVEFNATVIKVTVGSNVFPGDEHVKFNLVLTVDVDYSPYFHFTFKDGTPTFKYGVEFAPDLKVETDFSITYKKTIDQDDFLEFMKKTLKIKFAPVTVPAGPVPIVVTPEVDLTLALSLTGSIHAKGTVVHWKPSYAAGVEVLLDKEGAKKPEMSLFYDENPPKVKAEFFKDVQLTAEGTLKESFSVENKAKLYGSLTGALECEIYAKQKLSMGGVYDPSSGDFSALPIQVKPSAGLDGTAKLYLDLFKWKPEIKGTWTVVEVNWDPWIISDFKSAPMVVTIDGAIASENSVILSGAALADETEDETKITECGFEYYSSSPDQATRVKSSMDGSTYFDNQYGLMKKFVSNINNLQPNTTYHIRAYAINGKGTRFGDYIQIETKDSGIKTLPATKIRATKATVPIEVSSSFEIEEKGVIYSKNPDPTMISEGSMKVVSTDQGSLFSAELTDLSPQSTYYARGYIIASTGYNSVLYLGNVVTFETLPEGPLWNGDIVMERKYYVHDGGDYAYQSFSFVFDNGKSLKVGYYDTDYWTSYRDGRHGIYISCGDETWQVQSRASDVWVQEMVVVGSGGRVQYYSNGQCVGEHVFKGLEIEDASAFHLDMDPYGWWTGHYQAMDDFKLTTPFGIIEDDFEKNIFDINIWERPASPSGVYVEDGVMKTVQKTTNGDYHLKSKEISLVSAPVTPVYDGREIVLERKYLVHSGNEYAYHDFSLALNNEQTLSISYYDTDYWTSYSDSKHGVYIHMGDQEWYVQPRISDEWVQEKLVFTLDGSIIYYCNGELIKRIGMSGFNSADISSLSVTMNPYGWWTGHYQFMDDFKLTTPSGTIEDDFDKNIFDLNIWEVPENPNGVYVEDGVMKAIQKSTNGNYKLKSKPISLVSAPETPHYDEREIVLERKYLVHSGNEYAYPAISMVFNNEQSLKVGYYDTDYWTSYDDDRHGVYIHFENQEWYVQPRISDEWVNEKIVVSLSGSVRYYCNGKLMKEVGLPTLKSEEISSVFISVNPYGWWTGHYQYMDDFSLTAGGQTIRDNFNDGVLNSSIWVTPINSDGVYEADGYAQMHQMRTNQDFTLKSKPMQLSR